MSYSILMVVKPIVDWYQPLRIKERKGLLFNTPGC